jgi:hypothetical protein
MQMAEMKYILTESQTLKKEWVSKWLLFDAKWAIFQLHHGQNKLHSMRWYWYTLCIETNTLSWIFVVLAQSQQSAGRHDAPLGHIILITSQPDLAFSTQWCVFSGEATNTKFIVFGFTRTHDLPYSRRAL